MRFIDSHLHLADFKDMEAVGYARGSDTVLVTNGIDEASSLKGVNMSQELPELVRAFIGVHPSEADETSLGDWFSGALGRADGVGEIGLDPKYSAVRERQESLFREQLEAAQKQRKPVQVHSRGAEKDCIEILGTYELPAVLLHWFQGEEHISDAVAMGYYVSLGPALLVSKKLQRMAQKWDRERILVESDGPVQFSALGGAGGPALIPSVIFRLSTLLKEEFEETRIRIRKNSLCFLSSKP